MTEIIFVVEDAAEGGLLQKHPGKVFLQKRKQLQKGVKEAIECQCEPESMPKFIRLHMIKEELIAT